MYASRCIPLGFLSVPSWSNSHQHTGQFYLWRSNAARSRFSFINKERLNMQMKRRPFPTILLSVLLGRHHHQRQWANHHQRKVADFYLSSVENESTRCWCIGAWSSPDEKVNVALLWSTIFLWFRFHFFSPFGKVAWNGYCRMARWLPNSALK